MQNIAKLAPAPDEATLLLRARALIPVLAERSARAEELRRVPDETIRDFVASGLTRIVQPARFGGYEMEWDVLCEVAMTLARGCMSQAWVAAVLAEHAWLAGLFPLQAQTDIWGTNPDALISTGLVPTGSATRVEGGFRLSGKWPFSSGVHHTQWTILGELVRDAGQAPAMHFFLVPTADLRIIDDWHTLGMSGTGSCSVELSDVFVPAHRTLAGRLIAEGDTPGAQLSSAAVFRMPLSGFAPTVLAAVIVGAAEGIVDLFAGEVAAKSGKAAGPGSELALARIAESAAEAAAARLLILDCSKANMATLRAGNRLSDIDAQVTARNSAYATLLCRRAASRVFEASGARSLYRDSRLQRVYRDITSASAHAALSWDKISVAYGRFAVDLQARA
jgi:alkylation response protein AidB-like acyl-CoA dehydrogenase